MCLGVFICMLCGTLNLIYLIWRSDISNRARLLISRWSKMFARSQAAKKSNGLRSSTEAQNEMLLKQRQVYIFASFICSIFFNWFLIIALWLCSISEIMGDESWRSNVDNSVSILSEIKLKYVKMALCLFSVF